MAAIKHDSIVEGILVVAGVEGQIAFTDGYVDLPYEIALKVVSENPSWKFAVRPQPENAESPLPPEEAPKPEEEEAPKSTTRRRGGRA